MQQVAENIENIVYIPGSELALEGGFASQPNGIRQFAPGQYVDRRNPVINLVDDPSSVAKVQAIEFDKISASARRRDKGMAAQNTEATNFDMKPSSRRPSNRHTYDMPSPSLRSQPNKTVGIDSSPLFRANARPSRPGYQTLKTVGGAAFEMGLGFATGGPAGLLIAAASRIQASAAAPAIRSTVINIAAAKRAITTSPKQMFMPIEMELREVIEMVPKQKRERIPGAKFEREVTVMRPKKKLVWAPKMALAPTG